jgi:hypothetical protein
MRRRSMCTLAILVLSIGLFGCPPGPNITQVLPADGVLRPEATVPVTGTFVGVDPATAIVEVNGVPAAVSGQTFSLDVDLAPGANAILVELRDASNPAVRKRLRHAVIRGDSVAPHAPVDDGAGLRANDSFFESLPLRGLAEAGLADFVEENEFFQGGLGADLVDCLLDAAASADVDLSDEDGLRLSIFPDCTDMEGQHTFDLPFPLGDVTCRVTMSLGGSAWVEGDLEPDPVDPVGLEFDGAAQSAWEFDYDVDDPDIGACDAAFPEFEGLATAILDYVTESALPQLAATAADALRLEAEARVCLLPGGCSTAEERGFRLTGELEAVEEIDDALRIRADVLTEPLSSHGELTLRVADALPLFGLTTPVQGRPYDLALALTPTAINQLLAAATSQGFLAVDFMPALDDLEKIYLAAIFNPAPSPTVRFEARVPPVLNGTLVCPSGLALPRLQIVNAHVVIETELDEIGVVPLMTIAVDVEAGVRLKTATDADGNPAVAIELVVGPACPGTSVEAVVLQNPTPHADDLFETFVENKALASDLVGGVPPLPIAELVSLDGLDGEPAVELGLEIVELGHPVTSFQVYLNLLAEGAGVRVESDFSAGTESWTYERGDLTREDSGGVGGEGDGYLHGEPNQENDTSYFVAPAKFLGSWMDYDALALSLQSAGGSYYDSGRGYRGDVYLANGAMTARYGFGRRPAATWDRFTVPLDGSSGWTLGGGATSLEDVLGNVTAFHVRGEYGVGNDDASLDDVQLVVE